VNILVVCPHFTPDTAPTGEVMSAITNALADRGHRISVVTALPWYRLHAIEPDWRGKRWSTQRTSWGSVTRLHPFPTDKSNIPARALAFVGFTGLAALAAVTARIRPDVVFVMSPPLPLGVSGWLAAVLRRRPLVFNIQDVFPDAAVEVGAITNRRVITAASGLERWLYRRSDAVTVLSEDLRSNVAGKLQGHRPERVRVIPNFVDTRRIAPLDRLTMYRQEHDLGDRLVVMYAGNVGMSQSLDLLVEAAVRLRDRDDVVFVVNGGGSALISLEEQAAALPNVRFVGLQPRERLGEVLASADIHVVLLRRGLARASVPSKLYSILASARPVVASVDVGSEVARTIDSASAGIAVPPDDPDAFTAALVELLDDPKRRREAGASGRSFVEEWISPAGVAEAYESLFSEVSTAHRRRRR